MIIEKGDLILLFDSLPYDYEVDLPLTPITGVTIAPTPQTILATPDNDHLPCYVLPGTKLPGMGINHCCLINRFSESFSLGNINRESRLFDYLSALRLFAPVNISVAGHFVYQGDEDPIANPTLVNMQSVWQPDLSYRLSANNFLFCGRLLQRINTYINAGPTRLKYALMIFAQVTSGFSLSYQMSVLGLYSALEALFAPSGKNNYAKILGKRLGVFLSAYNNGIGLTDWLEQHYKTERHSLSHGFWKFSPDSKLLSFRNRDFGMLHEMVRLSLLGILSMHPEQVNFLEFNGKRLQKSLDALAPASGEFIQGQKMWLSENL